MSNENKQLGLIKAISEIIYPLKRASSDRYYRDMLFSALGWDFKNISGFPVRSSVFLAVGRSMG